MCILSPKTGGGGGGFEGTYILNAPFLNAPFKTLKAASKKSPEFFPFIQNLESFFRLPKRDFLVQSEKIPPFISLSMIIFISFLNFGLVVLIIKIL